MKNTYIIGIFFILISFNLLGQEIAEKQQKYSVEIEVDENAKKHDYSIRSAFGKKYAGILKLGQNAPFKLIVDANFSEPKTIEGMETRTYVDGIFNVELINNLNQKSIFSEEYKNSGKSSRPSLAMASAIKKLAANAALKERLLSALKDQNDKMFDQGCHATLSQLKESGTWEELNTSFHSMQYFENGNCADMAAEKLSRVSKALDELSCKKTVHELTILIESGQYNPHVVVNKLLAISPDAPCADEALVLAKRMGDQRKVSSLDRRAISQYLTFNLIDDKAKRRRDYRKFRWSY